MTLPLTIKSGTTRDYPQEGDTDWAAAATNWANDATEAINNAPTYAEVVQYDAVVGDASDVTDGIASHSDLAAAVAAVAAGDIIFMLDRTWATAATININKAVTIQGRDKEKK